MKHTTDRLGAMLLAALVLSSSAQAQAPGTPMPMVPSGSGASMSSPFPQGRNGGGFGTRMVFGVVKAVDAAANTLTITPAMGGDALTVKIGATTQIVRQTSVAAADLKANDQVQVSGIPTQVTASQIVAGQLPTGFPGDGRGGFGAQGQGLGTRPAAGGAGDGPTGQATATIDARVLQTSPLLLSLGNGVTISVKLDPSAKISRISTVALSAVKAGDQVFTFGQTDGDGTVRASSIGVNLGGGGFGGPGGPPAMMPAPVMPSMGPGAGSVGTQIMPNGE